MLGDFQKMVAMVALCILVVVLIILAIMLIIQKNDEKWPPYSSTCPDYWDVSNNVCISPNDAIGNNKKGCQSNSTLVSDTNGCVKLDYATHCALTWDGITNNKHLKKQCSK